MRRIRKLIHPAICWYLRRCGGAFHSYPYGKRGRYVVMMTDKQYGWYTHNRPRQNAEVSGKDRSTDLLKGSES